MIMAPRPADVIDIGLVSLLLWLGIAWLRTSRARLALLGLLILVAVYLVARQLELALTAWLLQGFFAVFVIVLVVVFQEDLRKLLEQIAVLGLRRKPLTALADHIDTLVRSLVELAEQRRGALVVIPGRDPLDRYLDGGVPVDAQLSESLLLSLFDPHSPGHDGAVLLSGERVARFAVHLPLSSNQEQLGRRGTRHAAALGLSERADALCLVVSEERGTLSVAQNGRLRTLTQPRDVADEIRRFFVQLKPEAERGKHRWSLSERWKEGLAAFGIASALWLLSVPGSGVVETKRMASVTIENLPQGFKIESIEPTEVEVVLAGPRRDVYFLKPKDVSVRIDAVLAKLGRRTFPITPSQVVRPPKLKVRSVEPENVKLSLQETSPS